MLHFHFRLSIFSHYQAVLLDFLVHFRGSFFFLAFLKAFLSPFSELLSLIFTPISGILFRLFQAFQRAFALNF